MSCEQFTPSEDARQLAVIDRGTGCIAPLCTTGLSGQAIPVQVTRNRVELRTGAADSPIELPRLQRISSGGIGNIAFLNDSGQLALWDISVQVGTKRLVITDGVLSVEDDFMPTLLELGLCETSCNGAEGMLGVKTITVDEEEIYQIVIVPMCCCEGTSEVEEAFDGNVVMTLNPT